MSSPFLHVTFGVFVWAGHLGCSLGLAVQIIWFNKKRFRDFLMRIRICQQVLHNSAVTGLWALMMALSMIILPLPAVATPVIAYAMTTPDITSYTTVPALFWHSKASKATDSQTINQTTKRKGKVRDRVDGTAQVLSAYQNQQSNVMVENVSGVVEAILPDDVEGSRHQRFIVQLANEQTVLIVHNVDIAPRIRALREGDRVSVKGEYEWNDRGGLIHWTHRDPNGSHEGGWIEHNSIRYE
jgi:hypothetical protein